MNPYTDHYTVHTNAVTALADAGIKPPTDWTRLAVRWQAFATGTGSSALAELTDAILTGNTERLAELHALALVDVLADNVARATVRNHIRAAVLSGLYAAYAPHAAANYTLAADLFDSAAQRLTAAAVVVDVEAAADSIITADNTIRSAWSDALLAAQDLDSAAVTLANAAALAGLDTTTTEATLALTIDPGDTKRRTVWEAWEAAPGRCGRWSALLAAGTTIRAWRGDLAEFAPYRRPLPLETRHIQVQRGVFKPVTVDPEEPTTEDTTPAPRKRGHRITAL